MWGASPAKWSCNATSVGRRTSSPINIAEPSPVCVSATQEPNASVGAHSDRADCDVKIIAGIADAVGLSLQGAWPAQDAVHCSPIYRGRGIKLRYHQSEHAPAPAWRRTCELCADGVRS